MSAPARERLRAIVGALAPDVRGQAGVLCRAYFWRTVAVGCAILAPWPLKLAVDAIVGRFGLHPLTSAPGVVVLALSAAFLLVSVADALAGAAEKNLSAAARENMTLTLRGRLVSHLLTLSPTLRTTHRSGELVLRIVDDSDMFVRVITKTLPQLFQHLLTLVATAAAMLWVEPKLAAATLVWLPVTAVIARRQSRKLWAASREKRAREGDACALAQEIVRGLAVIQASGDEAPACERFERVNTLRVRAGRRETSVAVSLERSLQVVQGLAMAVTTGGGALLVLSGRLTVGDLTLLTLYVSQLFKPVKKLNDLTETLGRGLAGGERLVRLFDERPGVVDTHESVPIARSRGVIELDGVSFAYPDRPPVLADVTMRLEPGTLTVLTGASGVGKSTILSLIVRLFDPSAGEIRLDGTPLPAITLRSLRSQMAVLSQDTHVFSGTLRAAMTPPDRECPDDALRDALKLVSLDEFVASLPDGFDTAIGEDAVNLSGGQRRRLALARAFLLDRPILLLDEPLANIDDESAAVILDALVRLRRNRTCFAVTHDAALMSVADRRYHLRHKRICDARAVRRAVAVEA